ncbi:MAG: ADP-forming succinate--CoA ligase subunit beta, partial [Phycisphaeraceae bacterium]
MKIHEYQSRELMQQFGISVPGGVVIDSPDQAAKAYEQVCQEENVTLAVVKAQVHAGGRGKGGGVKLVRSASEAKDAAEAILAKPLVTPQTGPEGVVVKKLLIAAGVDIEKEYYLGMAVDRATGTPVLIASSEGGVEIEEVAKNQPDAIIREQIDPQAGLHGYQARKVAFKVGFHGQQIKQAVKIMTQLVRLFLDTDASLVEINPLVVTPAAPGDSDNPDGRVLAIDAKINFDDNALYRQKQLQDYYDPAEEDPAEVQANKFGLSYIRLDGNIGCLVNGAGLAMSTMDIIKLHGGEPA